MDDLVENPFAKWEDKGDPTVPTATLQIYEGISELLKERNSNDINRASSSSMCVRRRWYQRTGVQGSPLTPRKMVNFLLGDLSERTLLYFIKRGCVGSDKLYSDVSFGDCLGSIKFQDKELEIYKQQTMSFMCGGIKVTGHADGFGKRNSDGQWELIEIKSAADYGFKNFQEEGPGDYLKQSHCLMLMDECQKLNVKSVRFFYLKKQTGHIWDRLHYFDDTMAENVRSEFLISNREEIPNAPYDYVQEKFRGKPTGKWTVPWQCQYCPYLKECKGEFTLDWKSDQFGHMKPLYYFTKDQA